MERTLIERHESMGGMEAIELYKESDLYAVYDLVREQVRGLRQFDTYDQARAAVRESIERARINHLVFRLV